MARHVKGDDIVRRAQGCDLQVPIGQVETHSMQKNDGRAASRPGPDHIDIGEIIREIDDGQRSVSSE